MNPRWIKLVYGYLRDVDYDHGPARSLGLRRRVAVLINGYPFQQIDYYYDTEVAVAVLREVLKVVPHDSVEFDLDASGDDTILSVKGLADYYVTQPPAAREPFHSGQALLDDTPTCMIETRNHCRPQAPEAYRGTYTFSFYTKDVPNEAITRACRAAAASCGIQFAPPLEGSEKPHISLLTRLHNFVVYDAEQGEQPY